MGGFAGLLGHAAAGFEGARQQDLQRQFADEQNRRGMAAEILGHIALDPNQPDEVRTPFLNAYMNLAKLPPDKKFDFGKHMQPAFDALSQYRMKLQQVQNAPRQPGAISPGAPLSMPPAPPADTATVTPAGTHAQALPPGVSGPPQQVPNGPPDISMPFRPMAFAGTDVQAPSQPPPPPAGFLTGAHGIAENAGYAAQQEEGGKMRGQIAARQDALSQVPGLDSNLKAGLMLGTPGLYGAMNKPLVSGSEVPGSDLIAKGVTKLDDGTPVDPSKFYNQRELISGRIGYAQTRGPGQVAATGGGLQSATQQQQQNAAIRYKVWQKENATQFGQRQSLLNQAFQLGVDRGYLGDANKAFVDSVKDYGAANKTMQSMDEAYKSVQANPNNQQAQLALLMSHIGMTLGVVKGARVGKAQIEEAENSRDMFAGATSKLNFNKNGDLDWSDPIRKGVTLTPDQMKQMVELGHQRMNILHQNIGVMHDSLDPNQMGTQPIGTSFNTPTPKAKGGSGGPPKQSPSGGTGAHQSFADWKKAQSGAVQ